SGARPGAPGILATLTAFHFSRSEVLFWVGANAFVFCLAGLISVTLHELGHAAVAAALRFKIFHVVVGAGWTVWRREVGGALVSVQAVPLFGCVVVASRVKAWLRLRLWLVHAAGPAASLLCFLSARHAMPATPVDGWTLCLVFAVQGFALWNLIGL